MAGGKPKTAECCRGCGEITLHSIWITSPGKIIRKVLCPDCQEKRGIIRKPTPRPCPACKSQMEIRGDRAYCNNQFCHAMMMV